MAIEVRQLTKPVITITGKRIRTSAGVVPNNVLETHADTTATAYTFDHTEVTDNTVGTDINVTQGLFNKADIPVFWGNVTLQLSSAKYNFVSYEGSGTHVGIQEIRGNDFGVLANMFYTINGRTPRRTKANLYKFTCGRGANGSSGDIGCGQPVTIRRNNGENIVIKARTYISGQASPDAIAIIRIVNRNEMQRLFNLAVTAGDN
jgi:hypothetical protein